MNKYSEYSKSKAVCPEPKTSDLEKKIHNLEQKLRIAESSNNYQGYGRFIVHRIDGEFEKYELMQSEIIQFGHTVPCRTKSYKKALAKKLDLIKLGEALQSDEKLTQPNEWLDDYVNNCMPYELENMIDGYDYEVELDGYAEICGYLKVVDTSSDTPDGYEHDSELNLEEPKFTPFKLEDLKESYYYNARTIAEWECGNSDEEKIEERYKELVAEGYGKTWQELESDEEAVQKEYRKMMGYGDLNEELNDVDS